MRNVKIVGLSAENRNNNKSSEPQNYGDQTDHHPSNSLSMVRPSAALDKKNILRQSMPTENLQKIKALYKVASPRDSTKRTKSNFDF